VISLHNACALCIDWGSLYTICKPIGVLPLFPPIQPFVVVKYGFSHARALLSNSRAFLSNAKTMLCNAVVFLCLNLLINHAQSRWPGLGVVLKACKRSSKQFKSISEQC
jgi:hypothetical protein